MVAICSSGGLSKSLGPPVIKGKDYLKKLKQPKNVEQQDVMG